MAFFCSSVKAGRRSPTISCIVVGYSPNAMGSAYLSGAHCEFMGEFSSVCLDGSVGPAGLVSLKLEQK